MSTLQDLELGINYGKIRAIKAVPVAYLAKESQVRATVVSGSPKDTEVTAVVMPISDDYIFRIPYFTLVTDPEVVGNIIVCGIDGSEDVLLASDQGEGIEKTYYASEWGLDYFYLKYFKVYAKAATTTTADRTVTIRFTGAYVRWVR